MAITSITKDQTITRSFPEMIPGAFCNKNYKFIRVAAGSISRLCLALFYQITAYCYRIVSSPTAYHYESLSRNQTYIRHNKFFTYRIFGKEIISFCVNIPQQIKNSLPAFPYASEDQALRSIYGDKAINEWIKIITKDVAIDLSALRRLKITDGCCLGMTLDFISQYLMNTSSEKTLQSLFNRYQKGAPNEAQLAQIFYRALLFLPLSTKSPAVLKRERIIIENHKSRSAELRKIRNLARRTFDKQSKNYFLSLISHQLKEIVTERSKDIAKMVLERDLIMAKYFKFTMDIDSSIIFVSEEIKELRAIEFACIVDNLLPDTYYVTITSKTDSGHAIAYIKTEKEKHIIYDPNLAILAVNPSESGARLWRMVELYIERNEDFTVSFSPCSLLLKNTPALKAQVSNFK